MEPKKPRSTRNSSGMLMARQPVRLWLLLVIAIISAAVGVYIYFSSHASASCTQTLPTNATSSSIQAAVNGAAAGSVICLSDGGTYGNLTFNNTSAPPASPGVTLRSVTSRQATVGSVNITGSWITISDLKVTGGILVQPNSHHITADNNLIAGGSGFFDNCNDASCRIWDTTVSNNTFVGPFGEDAIKIRGNYDSSDDSDSIGLLIDHNDISGVYETGQHSDAIQADWGGGGIVVRNNYIHNNGGQGLFIKDSPVTGLIVENNLFVHNRIADIPTGSNSTQPNWSGKQLWIFNTSNATIINNTLWDNDSSAGVNNESGTNNSNFVVKNNIFQNYDQFVAPSGTNIFDYNIVGSYDWAPPAGAHNLMNQSPTFVNRNTADSPDLAHATWDYHLASGSKGIDVGTQTSGVSGYSIPSLDKDGNPRVDVAGVTNGADGFYDMGAFEFSSGGGTGGDTTPPTGVAITAPTTGSTVSGSVSLSATASDNVGVAGVKFMLDGSTLIGTEDTSSPYGLSWDTTGVANGAHSLTAVARDAAGNTTTSSAVSVTVNNTVATKQGDINGDGSVNIFDLSILLSKYGTTDAASDLNSNGTVDVFDLSILLSKFGT